MEYRHDRLVPSRAVVDGREVPIQEQGPHEHMHFYPILPGTTVIRRDKTWDEIRSLPYGGQLVLLAKIVGQYTERCR